MPDLVPSARSFLFVPADRPEMLEKAHERGADALIVDLEDAVAVSAKETGRATFRTWAESLGSRAARVWVRVNCVPQLLAADLAALEGLHLAGVFLPKVEEATDLDQITEWRQGGNTVPVVAMIESAAGVLAAERIVRSGRIDRLAMGEVDLAADLGARPGVEGAEFMGIRLHLAVVSAAFRLPPPIGPVYTDFRDLDGLRRSSLELRRLGLWSRPAIHPLQVAVINEVFSPSPDEVTESRRLLALFEASEAAGRGVCVDERGRMVDEAVVRSARLVVAMAEGETGP